MKNGKVMTMGSARAKVASGLFCDNGWLVYKMSRYPIVVRRAKVSCIQMDGHFGQVFEIWTSNLFCQVFTLTLIYKPSLKSIRPKLAILSRKNSKNSPKWPYLKTPFCPSVIHQKAYSSYIFH